MGTLEESILTRNLDFHMQCRPIGFGASSMFKGTRLSKFLLACTPHILDQPLYCGICDPACSRCFCTSPCAHIPALPVPLSFAAYFSSPPKGADFVVNHLSHSILIPLVNYLILGRVTSLLAAAANWVCISLSGWLTMALVASQRLHLFPPVKRCSGQHHYCERG